jgi:hypothetical protein
MFSLDLKDSHKPNGIQSRPDSDTHGDTGRGSNGTRNESANQQSDPAGEFT